MTWTNVSKVIAALGVLAALAVVSGADYLDGASIDLGGSTVTHTHGHK